MATLASNNYHKRETVPIADLLFDPENPRLPQSLRRKKDNNASILTWMLNDAGVVDLIRSIGSQDYFDGEPLLVIPAIDSPQKFIVVEGNRRLAALKLMLNPDLANSHSQHRKVSDAVKDAIYKPINVSVIVYENRDDILSYLGYRHVTGIKSWGALAKARYLDSLVHQYEEKIDEDLYTFLAKLIGSRRDYVLKLLAGLRLYEKIEERNFYDIPGLDENSVDFSLITTALGYNNLQKFLGLSGSSDIEQQEVNLANLKDFTEWTFDRNTTTRKTRLEDSRNFGKLAEIVKDEVALNYFRNGYSIHDAAIFTGIPLETYRTLISSIRQDAIAALQTLSTVKALEQNDLEVLDDIQGHLRNIKAIIRDKLEADE